MLCSLRKPQAKYRIKGYRILDMSEEQKEEQKEIGNPIKWSLHDSHPELVENARAKLSEVVDP